MSFVFKESCCSVWSRLVVLRKYEAYSDVAARSLRGEFQDRIATVRVRVRVGPPT
jgi:hypothetical protein